jgi:hypothetical protein
VKALILCSSYFTVIGTPAETSPLPKDADGEPESSGNFNYAPAPVVGMLFHLSEHCHSDIVYVLYQCAQCTFEST